MLAAERVRKRRISSDLASSTTVPPPRRSQAQSAGGIPAQGLTRDRWKGASAEDRAVLESLDAAEHSAREADRAANRVRERIASGEISNVPYTQPVVEEHPDGAESCTRSRRASADLPEVGGSRQRSRRPSADVNFPQNRSNNAVTFSSLPNTTGELERRHLTPTPGDGVRQHQTREETSESQVVNMEGQIRVMRVQIMSSCAWPLLGPSLLRQL